MKPRPADAVWIKRALALARRAQGDVRHYPLVGAVVVNNGVKIAEGFFRRPGEPHAEVHALRRAGEKARGADIIVNLEPCSHFGTTPPCADAVIAAGIKRVVAGMTDPNPLVAGQGFAKLRAAGIEVVTGVLQQECEDFNRVFVKFITTRRPWVTMKAAMTLDGKIAARTGHAFWITGEAARAEGHRLRDVNQAVMVGAGTVRADDPELTVRLSGKGRHPRPVIISTDLDLPLKAKFMSTPAEGGPLIFTTRAAPPRRVAAFQQAGAEVVIVKKSRAGVDLSSVMDQLGKRKIASLMIEGGAGIHGAALDAGLVDEAVIFVAPKLMGGGVAVTAGRGPDRAADALRLGRMKTRLVGEDLMITGRIHREDQPCSPD